MKVNGELHTPDILTLKQVLPMILNRKLVEPSNGLDPNEKKKICIHYFK
jgi:hypothetical protein